MLHLLFAAMFFAGIANSNATTTYIFSKKTITVIINEKGNAIVGRDTMTLDELTTELQKRLWKSYTGTGKMYDAIYLQYTGDVIMGVKSSAMKAIQQAQKNALKEICLQLYKKLFEDLHKGQQNKIRNRFPILFQQEY